MSRLTLITLIICSACILGMGFGNVAWGQCKDKVSVIGVCVVSDTYTACSKNVINTVEGTIVSYGGYAGILAVLETASEWKEWQVPGDIYEDGFRKVTWDYANLQSEYNHRIWLDVLVGKEPTERGWRGTDVKYTADYNPRPGQ